VTIGAPDQSRRLLSRVNQIEPQDHTVINAVMTIELFNDSVYREGVYEE